MAPELVSTVVLLVLVLDPFGNVPIVVAAMREVPRERRRRIIVRECLVAWALLIAFLFGGKAFLSRDGQARDAPQALFGARRCDGVAFSHRNCSYFPGLNA